MYLARKITVFLAVSALIMLAGCNDATTIGTFSSTPVVNVILDDLGVVDEKPVSYADSRMPDRADLVADETEYIINPGDVLNIGIQDLFQSGVEWQNNLQVSDTGRITLPELGSLFATGLTELEFTSHIEDRLKEHQILRSPIVRVVVVAATKKVYTVDGQVPQPSRYQITEPDLRIIDALAQAGGVPQYGVDYVYVIRNIRNDYVEEQTAPANDFVIELEDIIDDGVAVDAEQLESQLAQERQELLDIVRPFDPETSETEEKPFRIVQHEDGFGVEDIDVADNSLGFAIEGDNDFSDYFEQMEYLQEVIRIDLRRLRNGDLSQNIVVRPSDRIIVPLNAVGVFYIGGQVNGPGPYQLSGDRMTLKQAVSTAGGFGPLAYPSRCDIVRRIGDNKEVTVNVNLQKIFEGKHPDIYVRPGDIINVGSHPLKRWEAVIRQSFRATYGFGFVYDRNLAYDDYRR